MSAKRTNLYEVNFFEDSLGTKVESLQVNAYDFEDCISKIEKSINKNSFKDISQIKLINKNIIVLT